MTAVNNVPDYASDYKYIIVNICKEKKGEDSAWFWGAFNDLGRASAIAKDIGGVVLDEWEAKS